MKKRRLGDSGLEVSIVGLGTWVMGGYMWGGSDDELAKGAILRSVELGVNLIDTAPVYGFGRSESLVGKVLKGTKMRHDVILSTKCGLEWDDSKKHIRRNSQKERVLFEIDQSLRRLQTDYIDLYQVHWPDKSVPFEETLEAMLKLKKEGKIRAIGVSNYSREQMEAFDKGKYLVGNQVPYNIFERDVEKDVMDFAIKHNIGILAYGTLCRGLLTGKFDVDVTFPEGDLRRDDPKFKGDAFKEHLMAVEAFKDLASSLGQNVTSFATRWVIDQMGVTSALCGARTAKQIEGPVKADTFKIPKDIFKEVDERLKECIFKPISPAFMAPPE